MSAYALPDFQDIAPDGTAIYASDRQTLTKFRIHSELSHHKSKAAGMPVYDDVEVIEMRVPGEKEPVIVAATEFHKRRFPREYEAFKKGQESAHTGTPLDLLFPTSPSTVKQLQAFHIFSIQQLASISDTAKTQIPMGQSLVDRAKEYLARAGAGQNFHAMEEMQRQIAALTARLEEAGVPAPEMPSVIPAEQPKRRGPGRPKAVVETPKETE